MNPEIKWIIGSVVFLILFVLGCYFWYQWDTAPYRKEYAETQQIIRQTKAAQKTDTDNMPQEATKTPAESDAQPAEKPTTKVTATGTENTVAEVVSTNESNTVSQTQEQNKTPVRVSQFGLGPFPERPPDYDSGYINGQFQDIESELMERVRIKLWTQGIKDIKGMAYSHNRGLIFPHRPDVVYVEYKKEVDPDGSVYRSVDTYGAPISREEIEWYMEGKPVPGFTILDISEGIEPYSFLGLQRP